MEFSVHPIHYNFVKALSFPTTSALTLILMEPRHSKAPTIFPDVFVVDPKITSLLKSTDCDIKSHQLQLDIKQFQEIVLQNKTADLHAYSSLQSWHLNWLEFALDAHIHAPGVA